MPLASSQPIDWEMLSRAASYYEALGFTYIEVPWIVPEKATRVTKPEGAGNFSMPLGDLVGSAEQSFIQMLFEGKLRPGQYYTITPCFRDEPVLDELHQSHFMKLELINLIPGPDAVSHIIDDAKFFLQKEFAMRFPHRAQQECFRVEMEEDKGDPRNIQKDLITHTEGWELGSYGIRYHENFRWVYGTGCAEPRWSFWLRTQENSI